MTEPIVELRSVIKTYPVGGQDFPALRGIDLRFEQGEFTGFVGPSGSGKTTLLNIIGTLDTPTNGTATVIGKDVSKLSASESAKLRSRHLGFIFQTYNLLPVYTVYENVEFPLILLNMDDQSRHEKVMQALEWVGLADRAKSRPGQLSGGQGQRVAIARAIIKEPDLILADEPTANLDAENSHNVLKILKRLNRELKTTFIFSTHDEKVITYLERKINLVDGLVAADELMGEAVS